MTAVSGYRLSALLEGGSFFEGPRWRDGCWFVSDYFEHRVLAVHPDGAVDVVLEVPGQPSGLGWLPDGSLLIASMLDKRLLRRFPDGQVSVHADLSALCPGPINDMVVDRRGRAYVGNSGFDPSSHDPRKDGIPTSSLVRVDPDGSARRVADDIQYPNGSVITADGRTLIVGESMGARYTAFTIAEDGTLAERRVWGQLPADPPIAPDGCTMDGEGHIWMADALGGPCRRLAPGGLTVDEISPPEGKTFFACMLGGDDGRSLLLCAAGPSAYEGTERGGSVLLTTTVDVPHVGLP
jgi:sugar lactone lactonase YvrE